MKKLLKTSVAVTMGLSASISIAATYVAPDYRVRIWQGSSVSFPDSQYTLGTTTAMGTIRTLKSNGTVTNLLTNLNAVANAGKLDMTSKYLSAEVFNGESHQRLTENGGSPGQCVAFAKAMTGAPSTPQWYRGKALSEYVIWNGVGYTLSNYFWNPPILPGTMLAHFQGQTKYPQSAPYGHVTIFLSWSYNSQGYIDGINVVDQNLVSSIAGNSGSSAGLIQKHKLPWVCTAGSSCGNNTYHTTFFSSNYHVVDVHGATQKHKHIIATLSRLTRECEKRGA